MPDPVRSARHCRPWPSILDNLLEAHRERSEQGELKKPNTCVETIESLSPWLDAHAEYLQAQQRLDSSSKPIAPAALEELLKNLGQGLKLSPDKRCQIIAATIESHDRFHPRSLNPTVAKPLGNELAIVLSVETVRNRLDALVADFFNQNAEEANNMDIIMGSKPQS